MFLLEGFNGVEASGGVDLLWQVSSAVRSRLSAQTRTKSKEKSKRKTHEICMFSGNFSSFLVKSVYVAIRGTAHRSRFMTANQLVLGCLLCRK